MAEYNAQCICGGQVFDNSVRIINNQNYCADCFAKKFNQLVNQTMMFECVQCKKLATYRYRFHIYDTNFCTLQCLHEFKTQFENQNNQLSEPVIRYFRPDFGGY